MDISTIFKDAVFKNKKIKLKDRLYGLVVDVANGQTIVCVPDKTLETDQKFEKGTWLSFRKNLENKLEDIKIEDAKKFPETCVHNGVVTIMSQAAAPNGNQYLNEVTKSWRYLVWSTEWNVVGDPEMLFARFSKEKIFNVRMSYKPGKQHALPETSYNWRITEIFNCFDSISQFQIIRAPWNLGRQQVDIDSANETEQLGFVYKKIQHHLFLATSDGLNVKVLTSSNYINHKVELGHWVYFEKSVELGLCGNRAFLTKVVPDKSAGDTIDFKDDNNRNVCEYIIEFSFEFNDNIKEALFEKSGNYCLEYRDFKILITKEDLNAELVKCAHFRKNITRLHSGDVVEAEARFVQSPIECNRHAWRICAISNVKQKNVNE